MSDCLPAAPRQPGAHRNGSRKRASGPPPPEWFPQCCRVTTTLELITSRPSHELGTWASCPSASPPPQYRPCPAFYRSEQSVGSRPGHQHAVRNRRAQGPGLGSGPETLSESHLHQFSSESTASSFKSGARPSLHREVLLVLALHSSVAARDEEPSRRRGCAPLQVSPPALGVLPHAPCVQPTSRPQQCARACLRPPNHVCCWPREFTRSCYSGPSRTGTRYARGPGVRPCRPVRRPWALRVTSR